MNVDEFIPTSERSTVMAKTANDVRSPAASLAAAVCGFVWEHAGERAARGSPGPCCRFEDGPGKCRS